MVGGWMGGFWSSFALLTVASGGPLHRYPRESEDYQNDLSIYANYTANEVCFSEGEVFQKGDMMPNPGPCEECRCEPPSIVCNMIKCPVNNNGCRTIQRANHCCPDYNCECDYNGQLYNDGERLDLPEEPCQVCYCKGGEVMCNSITCYHRDDCDPIQVPGQCCPKYENCPVRDMGSSSSDDKNVLVRSTNKTNHVPPKREMNPWLLTKLPPVMSSSRPKSSADPTTEGGNIIVVSDWLTERRTTTEDASSNVEESHNDSSFDTTVEPDLFTDSDRSTTVLKQEVSSNGVLVMKNSDNITPVDEVIFTRIDFPKQNQVVNLGDPVSRDTQNRLTTDVSESDDAPQLKLSTTEPSITEKSFHLPIKESFKEVNSSMDAPGVQSPLEIGQIEKSFDTKMSTKIQVKIKEHDTTDKDITSSIIANNSDIKSTNKGSSTTQSILDLSEETKTRDIQTEIAIENLLREDDLRIGEIGQGTTDRDLLVSYTTEKAEVATDLNEFTDNSLEDETEVSPKADKLKIGINEMKHTFNGFSETTPNSFTDSDVTASLFTEVNLKIDNIDKHDGILKSVLPKIREANAPYPNRSKITTPPTNDYSTETARFAGSETTEAIKFHPGVSEIKIKRNNLNGSSDQNNSIPSIVESTQSIINGSENKDITQQKTIISEEIANPQNEVSNNTTSTRINADPPVSIVEDNPFLTVSVSVDEFGDGKELISDAPPVLDLNSHVPFLQLGGHGSIDSAMNTFGGIHRATTTEKDIEVVGEDSVSNSTFGMPEHGLLIKTINITEDLPSSDITRFDKNNHSADQETKKDTRENSQVIESSTDLIFTTSHVPLTPGDLKALAEYLINDTIKTVKVNNITEYTPNQWLMGNLTSDENMSSILSAANISIAVMNKTDDKIKKIFTETTTNVGEPITLIKFEKDKLSIGNSVLNNVKTGNKTVFSQGKNVEYFGSPKINSDPEIPLNDEAKGAANNVKASPLLLSNVKSSSNESTKAQIHDNNLENYQNKDDKRLIQNYEHSPTSAPHSLITQTTTETNNLRFENVNPAANDGTINIAQNSLFRKYNLSDDTTTSFTSTFSVTTSSPQSKPTP